MSSKDTLRSQPPLLTRSAEIPASADRRQFLRSSVAVAGAAVATGAGIGAASAQKLEIPPTNKEPGRIIEPKVYGLPSKYEAHVKRNRTDVFVNRQNLSDWSMTPLQHQTGIITPNGLIFERHHAGIPDIDPSKHVIAVHGMVKQPMKVSMDDLLRYPATSKFHFL